MTQNIWHLRFADAIAAAVMAALAVAFAFWLLPADMLLDRWAWWGRISGDNASGLASYLQFGRDAWHWPLLRTVNLDPPQGVNIVFTDPIPLAAIAGKLWAGVTGDLPLYMGRWMVACFAMQAAFMFLLLRQLDVGRATAMAGAALSLLMPAFLFRFQHIGLVAQFVPIGALFAYVRIRNTAHLSECALWALLAGAILLLNAYLFLMCLPVVIAGFLDAALHRRLAWRQAAALVSLIFVVAIAIAYCLGIVGDGPVPGSALGTFSMNALSPVVPQMSSIPGMWNYILDATGGQYEGYNYLGIGILALLTVGLVAGRRQIGPMVHQHAWLVVAMVALTLFAISPIAYVGTWRVANLPYSWIPVVSDAISQFRSSGRVFWPVGYGLLALSVVLVWRAMRPATAPALVLLAVVTQFWDVAPLRHRLGDIGRPADQIDRALWGEAIAGHTELTIYPDFYCASVEHHSAITQLHLLAARAGIPANATYVNRKRVDCAHKPYLDRLDVASVTADPLMVALPEAGSEDLIRRAAPSLHCLRTELGTVCSKHPFDPAILALETSGP